ncbi:MAG: FAD-dependent oxidoreductase, partial [Actinomycetota bacterium]
MRRIQTEVLVVGGGATGTGVLRDLAMRGFDALLVEQRDLTHGTTGRFHGLLHSGGRYAVKDPEAATECIEENRVLRRIMPHCIEDTGGYFVVTPWDDPGFIPTFLEGCRRTGVPAEEIPVAEALRREPLLNPDITHCIEVPDAAADAFLAAISTV